jgi:hypothetical protein
MRKKNLFLFLKANHSHAICDLMAIYVDTGKMFNGIVGYRVLTGDEQKAF